MIGVILSKTKEEELEFFQADMTWESPTKKTGSEEPRIHLISRQAKGGAPVAKLRRGRGGF